jgi:hypothetical protein
VQVVDVRKAEANFAATGGPSSTAYALMIQKLNTDGQGFGQDAIVATLPLPVNFQTDWYPHDLDVGDYVLGGFAQPLVFVAAESIADRRARSSWAVLHRRVRPPRRAPSEEGRTCARCAWPWGASPGGTWPSSACGSAGSTISPPAGPAVVDIADPMSPTLIGLTHLELSTSPTSCSTGRWRSWPRSARARTS